MNKPNDTFYPLATSTWDDQEIEAIMAVVRSDRYTMGPRVKEFEQKFAEYFGAKYAVMVNSGSSANLIAVAAGVLDDRNGLLPGDEILVPAVSWATTYFPLQQYGLKLRFVDVNLDTLNMDLELAEHAITDRTRGIFWVSLLGNPADRAGLRRLAETHNLIVWEDNCESMGAQDGGKFAGTFGQMGTFSTYFSHHISTMEGGVVVTDDLKLYQIMVSLRSHGWTRELPDENFVHPKSGDQFEDLFRFVLPGYNLRPLEMSGAIGVKQLEKLPLLLEGRRANARLFLDSFADIDEVRVQKEIGSSAWFGFSMVLQGRLSGMRSALVEKLLSRGIECRPIVAGNFTRNPVMSHLEAAVPESLTNADVIHTDGLFVGNHHYPVPDQIAELRATVLELLSAVE